MTQNLWIDIPMGPALQTYLESFREQDVQPPLPPIERRQEFANMLLQMFNETPVEDQDLLTGLVDELVTLGLGTVALHALQENTKLWNRDSFQRTFLEALAYMTTGDLEQASECFHLAHKQEPSEPAPYCNLAMILGEQGHIAEAMEWAKTGLEQAPDHIQLWKLLGKLYQDDDKVKDFIEYTQTSKAWVGLCVAAEYTQDPTVNRRVWLEKLYKGGERSMAFLTEYSGCLGSCGHFEGIPSLLWDARHQKEPTPWELELNGLQAFLSMENDQEFLKESDNLLKRSDVPEEVRTMITGWQQECKAEAEHHGE